MERKYAHSFEEGAQSLINRTLNDVAKETMHLLDAVINETRASGVVAPFPKVRGAAPSWCHCC